MCNVREPESLRHKQTFMSVHQHLSYIAYTRFHVLMLLDFTLLLYKPIRPIYFLLTTDTVYETFDLGLKLNKAMNYAVYANHE